MQSIPRSRLPWNRVAAGFVYLLACALPAIWLCALVFRYGVDVPLVDQWHFVSVLEKHRNGALRFVDLAAFHNEHPFLFPRLTMLALARLTDWNIRCELALSIALAVICCSTVVLFVSRSFRALDRRVPQILFPTVSLAIFSLSQWENWLWGWQLGVFLNVLAAVIGLIVLSSSPTSLRVAVFSAAMGVVATFSFAAGVLFWPAGVLVWILSFEAKNRPFRWRAAAMWLAVGAICICIVIYITRLRGGAPAVFAGDTIRLVGIIVFAMTYLGSPATSFMGSSWPPHDPGAAAPVGFFACLVLVAAVWRLSRCRLLRTSAASGLLSIAVYGLGSAFLTALGRVGASSSVALASRYRSFSILFWVATLGLCALAASSPRKAPSAEAASRTEALLNLFLALSAMLLFASSFASLLLFQGRWNFFVGVRDLVCWGHGQAHYGRFGMVEDVQRWLPALSEMRLSLFRNACADTLDRTYGRPLREYGQRITVPVPPRSMTAGKAASISAEIQNPTSEHWSAEGDGSGFRLFAVTMSYHWLDLVGRPFIYDGIRTPLPRDVPPGESVSLTARIEAPPAPGEYILRLTLIQEGLSWFETGALDVPVTVMPEPQRGIASPSSSD